MLFSSWVNVGLEGGTRSRIFLWHVGAALFNAFVYSLYIYTVISQVGKVFALLFKY